MPYRRRGRIVQVKRGGKWRKKSRCRSAASAKSQIRLLQGIKHGWKPTRRRRIW